MLRSACLLMLLWLSTSAGCAMCASCDDYNYGSYGGRWQRDDPTNGRVGSIFEPAGAMVIGQTSPAEDVPAAKSEEESGAEESPEAGAEESLLETGETVPEAAAPAEEVEEKAKEEEDAEDLTGVSLPLLPQNAPIPGQRSVLGR